MATYTHNDGQTDLSVAATYSPAAVPTAGTNGDTLTFVRAGAGFALTNLAALAGRDFLSVVIGPGWRGNFGDGVSSVEFDAYNSGTGNGMIDYQGAGDVASFKLGTVVGRAGKIVFRPSAPTRGSVSGPAGAQVDALYVSGGTFRVLDSVAVGTVDIVGSAQVVIETHASDTVGNVTITGSSTLTIRRRLSGTLVVPPGCTVYYNVKSSTTTGKITLVGGKLVWINGAITVDGYSGELDRSGLESSYALTITDFPGLTERVGPVVPTETRTTPMGVGSKKV